jgi:hypothetical protein
VFPEALGCPASLVLETGVCAACNNGLGRQDQALVVQFELPAFMAGIPRKRGRPPSIDGWASLAGRVGPDGPELSFNAGPDDQPFGARRLKPASAATGVSKARFEIEGATATAHFSLEIGRDPLFVRSLYKTAINWIAHEEGVVSAAADAFAAARRFVLEGEGEFAALLVEFVPEARARPLQASIARRPGSHPVVAMVFFGLVLAVDLDPAQAGLLAMESELKRSGDSGWTRLEPPRRPGKPRRGPTRVDKGVGEPDS